jgi:hypothetical protein
MSKMRIQRPGRVATITGALIVVLGLVLLTSACSSQEPEQIAEALARDWAKERAGDISREIATAAVGEIPIATSIVASVVAGQINDTIQWDFASPVKNSDARYEVTATASISFTVPIPILGDKAYSGSVNYELDIDTEKKEVENAKLAITSLRIKEIDQEE